MSQIEQLQQHLHTLRMPTAVDVISDLLNTATRETWSLEKFLTELLEQELEGRHQRRTERLQKSSHLPAGKNLANFEQEHLSLRLRRAQNSISPSFGFLLRISDTSLISSRFCWLGWL